MRSNLGGIMLTGFIRYFFRVLWHIKVIIMMLVTLMVPGAGALTLFDRKGQNNKNHKDRM